MVIHYIDKYNRLSQHPKHLDRKSKRQLGKLAEWKAIHEMRLMIAGMQHGE